MSKLWSLMLILVVALFVAVGSARAAEGEKKDGKKRERPTAEQIFKKLDADKDGKLTVDELAKSRRFNGDKEKAKAAIEKMDTNKNGSVCVKELTEAFKKRRGGGKKDGEKKGGDRKKAPEKK